VRFADRADAGRRLARCLGHLRDENVVVVGLPRGGVPVAVEVAQELGAPLDVIVVRKLGVPFQPELAMGAIGEDGARMIESDVIRAAGITPEILERVELRERAELHRRVARFRDVRERVPLAGRVVVIVDDGVATGSTARAACQVAQAQGAARVVLAVPVAPRGWTRRLGKVADELVCVASPWPFASIGRFYADFSETTDEEVLAGLARAGQPQRRSEPSRASGNAEHDPPGQGDVHRPVDLPVGGVQLAGRLTVPNRACGVVVFAHGSGSSRHSPRNQLVARMLNHAGLATLLFDLLTSEEGARRANVFDIDLLSERLTGAITWLRGQPALTGLLVGLFGASTGAAAALRAAGEPGADVAAVVCRGGRPDLAGPALDAVRAPTLLIVGGEDHAVLQLNRRSLDRLRCEARLVVVPGATHLFDEPGALQAAAEAARAWFVDHLSPGSPPRGE
jgi:putative phosphoribosyl transferase